MSHHHEHNHHEHNHHEHNHHEHNHHEHDHHEHDYHEHNHHKHDQHAHEEHHGGCAHCAEKLEGHAHGGHGEKEEYRGEILELSVAAVLFVLGIIIGSKWEWISLAVFVATYLLLGRNVLKEAAENIIKGKVFDENFLMGIATLAAFAIGEYPEAVGIMLFYRIGELFEDIAIDRSRDRIMKAVDMRPETVIVVHDHGNHEIPAEEAKVGDILLVRVGDRIPVDGVLVEGESFLDTSPVTGEPVPVKVTVGSSLISGCVNTSGVVKMKVEKELQNSMVSRILKAVEDAGAGKPQVERFISRFAGYYTPCVVLLAVATAIIPSLFTGDWSKWIYTAITFLVISCPCALVISIPLAYFAGIGVASGKNILPKGGVALESLKKIKAVVMDKTGTLTYGVFEVQPCEDFLLKSAAECEVASNHPIAKSIVKAAKERNISLEEPEKITELAGKGIIAETKEGTICCGNALLMEEQGLTVSCEEIGGTVVYVAKNKELLGHLVVSDRVKEDAADTIKWLHKKGIHTVMLTGDSKENAEHTAKELGISDVYAKLLPGEKLEKLTEVRSKYGPVMFVGDGINDAPVLAGADVGAAMGSGADAAIEAADVVFMGADTGAIKVARQIAESTGRVAKWNVVIALGVKALVMVLGLLGFANMWMSVFSDTGVAMICVLNSVCLLWRKR